MPEASLKSAACPAGASQALTATPASYPCHRDTLTVLPVQHPAQISNYRTMNALLAVGLIATAVATLGLTLFASVRSRSRSRRRDLAVLKTIGFTPAPGGGHGRPASRRGCDHRNRRGSTLGIILWRWLWTSFARQIYAVPEPTVPIGAVLLVSVGTLVLVNLAALPGWTAARTPAALALRAE